MKSLDEKVYDKLREAELEEERTEVRYTSEEILAGVDVLLELPPCCRNGQPRGRFLFAQEFARAPVGLQIALALPV